MKLTTVLLCFAGVLAAQQSPVIQAERGEVLVDAIVTGKNGAYISDLTAKDFRLSQDGKEQPIRSSSLESASAAAESAQTRSLVLYFDETSLDVRDQIAIRQAVSSFIDAEAGPNHMMAIATFNGSMRITQSFTDNAGRLKDALSQASFRGLAPSAADSDRSRDPGLVEDGRGRATGTALASVAGVRNMIRSLGELGKSLAVLPGRKIVILFTGTLPYSSDQKSEIREAVDAANKSRVAIYAVDARPVFDQTNPGASATPQTRLPGYTQRGGPGGGLQGDSDTFGSPLPDPGPSGQEVLFGLANGTGGFVVRNTSNVLGGLQNIGKEQDQYYVLTYVAPESKEGSCHALRVKVDRKGTTVRTPSTYCAENPSDLVAASSAGKELESRAAGAQAGGITASLELPYFYLSPSVARVNLAMEIPPDALKFQNQRGKLHAEINLLGVASSADGSVGARFSEAVTFDFTQAEMEKLKGAPLHYEKEFKIAPGQYRFSMAFSSGVESFGKFETPLDVPQWKAGELMLSSVVLGKEARPAAADAGLGPGASLTGDHTPLVAQGVQMVPTGSSQFVKSEPAFFYFEVYDSNPASVTAQMRIVDRASGASKWDSGPQKLSVPQQGGSLPLTSLSPGSYRLEVTVSGPSGRQVKQMADFQVTEPQP